MRACAHPTPHSYPNPHFAHLALILTRGVSRAQAIMDASVAPSERSAGGPGKTKAAEAKAGARSLPLAQLAPKPPAKLPKTTSADSERGGPPPVASVDMSGCRKALTALDVQYLREAAEALTECRRTLKYTYASAYYMKDGGEKVRERDVACSRAARPRA